MLCQTDGSPWKLWFGLVIVAGTTMTPMGSHSSLATMMISQAPLPSPKPQTSPSPASSPTQTPQAKPSPSPTPNAKPSSSKLYENVSYIGTCRSSGASPLNVFTNTALNRVVSELPAYTRVTLTGIIGEGIVQLREPVVGWAKSETLLTNCDAGR